MKSSSIIFIVKQFKDDIKKKTIISLFDFIFLFLFKYYLINYIIMTMKVKFSKETLIQYFAIIKIKNMELK
jgi:hypothetical protein